MLRSQGEKGGNAPFSPWLRRNDIILIQNSSYSGLLLEKL